MQGSNLDLLHCRQILYCLNHQGAGTMIIPKLQVRKPRLQVESASGRASLAIWAGGVLRSQAVPLTCVTCVTVVERGPSMGSGLGWFPIPSPPSQ